MAKKYEIFIIDSTTRGRQNVLAELYKPKKSNNFVFVINTILFDLNNVLHNAGHFYSYAYLKVMTYRHCLQEQC